jgi:aminoglycoside/choline kinase family phosphotransferase
MLLLYKEKPMPPPAAVPSPVDPAVERFLARALARSGPFELELLAGGASPRRFYRVALEGGERAVLMLVPPDTPDVAFARERGRPWPFLEVREMLEHAGVRVPRLLSADTEAGLLLVDDLGSTLAEHLSEHPEDRESLYRTAATDLARAQRALHPLPEQSVVRERAFDEALYRFELEHFWEWGVEARGVPGANRSEFERGRDFLVTTLAALPRGFCHRDYQSRNLMVVDDGADPSGAGQKLAWIDFQDALMGPRAYDLVALLCDSYQPYDRDFVERRLSDYATERGLSPAERAALGREFDLIAVQRKLKDAGRFVFIERKRNDASFLEFVDPTLSIVLHTLDRLRDVPELAGLAELARAAQGP